MPEQYNPKHIARMRQVLESAPGLDVLWFTGLEHAPWFEDHADQKLIAQLDHTAAADAPGWLANHLRQSGVVGDFLLRLNDVGDVPWVRARLSPDYQWLPVLLNHSTNFAFVSPTYTVRIDVQVRPDSCAVYIQHHSAFDLDADE